MKTTGLVLLAALPLAYVLVARKRSEEEARWPEEQRLLDSRLFNPPYMKNEEDRYFEAWIRDGRSGAPLTDLDLVPRIARRGLTPFEKWALRPYFPYAPDLDGAVLNNGIKPPGYEHEDVPVEIHAATNAITREVYFPHAPRSFLDRWWLAALAHELWHVAQLRIGLTPRESVGSLIKWGYESSPIEVQARYQQARVYDGLAKSARTFFAQV